MKGCSVLTVLLFVGGFFVAGVLFYYYFDGLEGYKPPGYYGRVSQRIRRDDLQQITFLMGDGRVYYGTKEDSQAFYDMFQDANAGYPDHFPVAARSLVGILIVQSKYDYEASPFGELIEDYEIGRARPRVSPEFNGWLLAFLRSHSPAKVLPLKTVQKLFNLHYDANTKMYTGIIPWTPPPPDPPHPKFHPRTVVSPR